VSGQASHSKWAWSIGSIRGIPLRVHATFPLILVWAAWEWGQGGSFTTALYGIGLVLALFVCVVLHELGHAFVARWRGIVVEEVLLLPLGGLAQFRTPLDNPRDEWLIAVAGPLVNLALIVMLLPTTALSFLSLTRFGLLEALITPGWQNLTFYLLIANALLAGFNLLPIFPMDGGRMLRATLAFGLSYERATRIAVRLGQVAAILMAVYGFFMNIWFLLIGVFLFFTAEQEIRHLSQRRRLDAMRVYDHMRRKGLTFTPSTPVRGAYLVARMSLQPIWPVVEGGRLSGLVSRTAIEKAANSAQTLADIMQTTYPVLSPNDTLYHAQTVLAESRSEAAAVVENDVFLGLLSIHDIIYTLRHLNERDE